MKTALVRAALVSLMIIGGVTCGWAQGNAGPERRSVPVFSEPKKGADPAWPELAPVSLELVAASMDEVNAELSKATGVPFAAGRGGFPAAFTLSVKERPFWEVFQELSKQNTLIYRPAMWGVDLSALGGEVPMLVSGPVLFVAEVTKAEDWAAAAQAGSAGRGRGGYVPGGNFVIPRFTGRGLGAEQPPPEGAQFVVRLAAIADPRLITTRAALEQVEVRDDAGNALKVIDVRPAPKTPSATTGPWQPREVDYDRISFSTWRITVAGPEGGGKSVGSVKGVVKTRVSTKDVSVRLDDVENKHQGETIEIGGVRFTLGRLSLRDNQNLSFQYGVELRGEGAAAGAVAADSIAPLRIEVQNAAGQPVIGTMATRRTTNGNLSARSPAPFPFKGPFDVVLRASEKMEAMELPFEMKVGKGE